MSKIFTFLLATITSLNLFAQSVFINEIHYDNTGTDTGEAIELAASAGADLTGWSIVLYNGSNGTAYNTTSLSGIVPDGGSGVGFVVTNYPTNGIQNGSPDGIALVDDLGNVMQFISYEGEVTAVDGPAIGLVSTDIGIAESSSTPAGNSLQLTGTGEAFEDFTWIAAANTFGAVNEGQQFGEGGPPSGPQILINEIDADQTGTDAAEFIELYDGGVGNSSLDGLVVVLYNGSTNVSYNAIDLDGLSTDGDGYFVIGSGNVPNVDLAVFSTNGLQNGADAVALYTGDAEDFPIGSAITTENLIDAIVYDTNDADDAELITLLNPGQLQLNEDENGAKDTESLQRLPNGTGGARNTSAYATTIPTPGAANAVPVADFILINEIDADQSGTDAAEFVELYDGGAGNTSLDGLVLVLFNGSNDASYNAIDLNGFSTDENGYFVIGSANVDNVDLVAFTTNGLQNGADAVALYAGSVAEFPAGTPITTVNLKDAIVYDTSDGDDAGLLALLNPSEPQVNENENANGATESLQRLPNGDGGPRNTSSVAPALPTPGEENGTIIVLEPITIAEARAQPDGTNVKVTGVLTVSDQFGGSAYIQDATGGIAVFDSQLHGPGLFEIGDQVTITGVRSSFNDQVQIGNLTEIIDLGPVSPVVPLNITASDLYLYAGQLVQIDNIDFEQQGDLVFGNSNYSVTDASAPFQLRFDGDVEELIGLATPTTTCASTVGVVGRFRDVFQLLPRQHADIPCLQEFKDPADDISIDPELTLDIATWNIEWFGDEGNFPASDEVQKDSVRDVIEEIDADIIAVQEITDVPLFEQLVMELPGYSFILSDAVSRPNDPGTKQQLGFIYKTDAISILKTKALLESIHPLYNGGDDSNLVGYPSTTDRFYASGRLPFLMKATVTVNGQESAIDFVALHARANSGSDAFNRYEMRKYDVEVLKDSLDAHFADSKLVILGDFNDDLDETVADISETTLSSYVAYTDDPGHYNFPTLSLSELGRRSFVFRENMIDHIMLSDELGANYIDGSASVGYEFYDADYANTTSDHMPVSIRLYLANSCQGAEVVEFDQGMRKNGREVHKFRSIPEKALGAPYENWWYNFVSLGFGGSITLKMSNPIFDVEGNDFKVVESTGGFLKIKCQYYPEKAEVFASEDGVDFTSLGTTCLGGKFDLEGSGLSYANYIKVVDVSDPADIWHPNADGYDLDGIVCLSGSAYANARSADENLVNYAPNEEPWFEIFSPPYPNPSNTEFRISIASEDELQIKAKIYNNLGETIREHSWDLTRGMNDFTLKVDNLETGIYHLKILADQEELNTEFKLMVQ